MHVWKDAEAKRLRTDTYGGVNSLYILQVLARGALHSCLACTAARAGAWSCSHTLQQHVQVHSLPNLTGSACATQGTELEIYPRVDQHMCRVYDDDDEVSVLEAPVRAAPCCNRFVCVCCGGLSRKRACAQSGGRRAVPAPVAFALLSRSLHKKCSAS